MKFNESKATIIEMASIRNEAKRISDGRNGFYDEYHFKRMFDLERKRTELSRRPFILILIDVTGLKQPHALNKLQKAFLSGFRETDIRGWYREDSIIGIIFTELGSDGQNSREAIIGKTLAALNAQMGPEELRKLYITFNSYPKDLENSIGSGRIDLEINHDLTEESGTNGSSSNVRKLTNLVGSFLALIKVTPRYFNRVQ